ncbi:hypothetical protein VCHA39O224_10140 [Vibrio chagasii]|nr:hypothetical protein VCHA39O224_10140 [Vibrio chagasii]
MFDDQASDTQVYTLNICNNKEYLFKVMAMVLLLINSPCSAY